MSSTELSSKTKLDTSNSTSQEGYQFPLFLEAFLLLSHTLLPTLALTKVFLSTQYKYLLLIMGYPCIKDGFHPPSFKQSTSHTDPPVNFKSLSVVLLHVFSSLPEEETIKCILLLPLIIIFNVYWVLMRSGTSPKQFTIHCLILRFTEPIHDNY